MSRSQKSRQVVAPVLTRWYAMLTFRTLFSVLVCSGMALLLLVLLDVVFILPQDVRGLTVALLLCAGLLSALIGAIAMIRLSPIRVARQMETRTTDLGTSLTNAVQLSETQDIAPITDYLRDEAVRRGRSHAESATVWPVLKRSTLGFGAATVVVGLLWLIGIGIFNDVFDAVFPRLFDPTGDHPPYSRLSLEVDPGSTHVIYGGQIDIHATAHGAPVDKLYLESETEQGVTRSVMFRRPDGSYLQTLTNLRQPTRYWVTDGRTRSLRYPIDVVLTPRIELIEYTTEFPQYTGLASVKRDLDSPEMKLPKRTTIDWRIASNRPLASGQISLTPLLGGDVKTIELKADAENSKVVTGSFEVDEALAYAIRVKDVDGIENAEPYLGRVTIKPDRSPRIYILEPGRQAVATPESIIPVHVRAEDDYKVQQVIWFRGFNESIERPSQMTIQLSEKPGLAHTQGEFNLADLGVRPGDRVEYFFEAEDNDPDGPNIATSRLYSLDIISKAQYEQVMRRMMAQRGLLERYMTLSDHLRRLAEQAQTTAGDVSQGKSSPQDAADALQDALDKYSEALEKTLAAPEMFDVEAAFNEQLKAQRAQLRDLKQRTVSAGKSGSSSQQQFDQIAVDLAEMAGMTNENVGEPARQIVEVVRLMRLSEEYITLTRQQGELAKLTRRFEDIEGELSRSQQMALRELASAQQRIRDRLNEWMVEVDEAADDLPDDPAFNSMRQQAQAFIQAVQELQIPETLTIANGAFADSDGPNAYNHALVAHELMDSLITRSQGMQGEGSQCLNFNPALQESLGNSLDQIMAALNNDGSGSSGSANGYGLFGESVNLYGPGIELPEPPESGGMADALAAETSGSTDAAVGSADDPQIPTDTRPTRVSIQEDVPFPLSYRDLVGEYFRVVAEDEIEEGQ